MRSAMRGAGRLLRLMAAAAAGSPGSGAGPKRPHPEPPPRIGTHDGTFHCDEVLACYLLRLLPRYRDAELIRTRDPQRLAQCDVVVDVGGEYDPERHRYDHHQRSFTQTMRSLRPDKPWTTKLSSAGLVYCHFGSQILAGLLGQPEDGPVVTALYDKVPGLPAGGSPHERGDPFTFGGPSWADTHPTHTHTHKPCCVPYSIPSCMRTSCRRSTPSTTASPRRRGSPATPSPPPSAPAWATSTPAGTTPTRTPRRGSGGRWSWLGVSSWTGWTTTTVPGCLHGGWWRKPSRDALRWMPAGWCWSCPRAGAPGRSTSWGWSRSWGCLSPSSSSFSRTTAGSGVSRASQQDHTPSRAGSPCPSPGAGSGMRLCPSSPASPAASSSTPAASSAGTARGTGPWPWPEGRWHTQGGQAAAEAPQNRALPQHRAGQGWLRPDPLGTRNGIATGRYAGTGWGEDSPPHQGGVTGPSASIGLVQTQSPNQETLWIQFSVPILTTSKNQSVPVH